ncbi:ankyrin repeat domain-containing protein 52 [Nannizzia gypsea CBS 118893]|uniref:Ankyrin repeat domain-containing protein 52 n=1 Tax=Arthroderma gypseum (strain ATCC MYA-4604 / CBS 118893) TaxID=535722 RepID=E4UQ93_ARTGP|nr:ankyrin repeat domain-containing protein 52 [Nannizzia gypsea CBS 118893]EFQ99174.1 ankyrin repeat domain-containing protein 52 [Nannizzia gypsea CBS 118893]
MSPATVDSLPYEILSSVLSYIPVVEYNNIKLAGSRHLTCIIREWTSRIPRQKYIDLLQQQDEASCRLSSGKARTALEITIEQGNESIVRQYIHRYGGAKTRPVNRENRRFISAFHIAALHGATDILRLLMDRINLRCRKTGGTPLHMAVKGKSLAAIKLLVENGADVNAVDFNEYTPLGLAKRLDCSEDVLQYLKEQGGCASADEVLKEHPSRKFADLVWKSTDEAASIADLGLGDVEPSRSYYQSGVMRLFGRYMVRKKSQGSKPSEQFLRDLIGTAVTDGVNGIVEALIDDGFQADSWSDTGGNNLLHKAIASYNTPIVGLLVKSGVNYNHKAKDGSTPFHQAASSGYVTVLEEMISAGVPVNLVNDQGWTAIHCPQYYYNYEGHVGTLVKKYGADIEFKDKDGRTPLHVSATCARDEIFEDLLDNGADINARDNDQETPLMIACKGTHAPFIDLLMQRGADITLLNANGRNAMEVSNSLFGLKMMLLYAVDPQLKAKIATMELIRQTKVDDPDDEIPDVGGDDEFLFE